jgi:hypothetical protein
VPKLLSAGGRCMLRSVSFLRCFDSAGINPYAKFVTLNPSSIEIVRIPIFLEGDGRLVVRERRLCWCETDEHRVQVVSVLDL